MTTGLSVPTGLPVFRFAASGLPDDQAFEGWRQIMARMFLIDRNHQALPRGGMSAFLLGDVMANRSVFNAQHLTRDRSRIGATPDHLVFQLYRSGGFSGEMGGAPVRVSRGQIAVCDLRRPLDVRSMTSSTVGLSIPRHLLDGVDLDRLSSRLDPARERLLAARMMALHHRLPQLASSDIPAVTAELLDALRRLLDPSACADALDARELDADLLTLAERVIVGALGAPHLSPAMIAERLGVSRATLYRVFAPLGGVMRHVWRLRLEAVRAALEQPSVPRTLSRLASDHGFSSAAHLSRSFRAAYGAPPRDWRAQQVTQPGNDWQAEAVRLNACWRDLGS